MVLFGKQVSHSSSVQKNVMDILVITTQGKVKEIEWKENHELKESCVRLQKQNSGMQTKLQKRQEVLETLKSINKKLEQKVKEQKDSWESKLFQLKEQNQKMFSENEDMGVRKSQFQAQKKDVKKLLQGDQGKIEQLKHLKKIMTSSFSV